LRREASRSRSRSPARVLAEVEGVRVMKAEEAAALLVLGVLAGDVLESAAAACARKRESSRVRRLTWGRAGCGCQVCACSGSCLGGEKQGKGEEMGVRPLLALARAPGAARPL